MLCTGGGCKKSVAEQLLGTVELFRRIGAEFFNVVPRDLRSYCSLNSRICHYALKRLGVESMLRPCQLWHLGPRGNFVVGFVGNEARVGKWDGHLICVSDMWIIDSAVSNLATDFGLQVPDVIVGKCFDLPSRVFARGRLSDQESLMWVEPPRGFLTIAPEEPHEIIEQYGNNLADAVIRDSFTNDSPALVRPNLGANPNFLC